MRLRRLKYNRQCGGVVMLYSAESDDPDPTLAARPDDPPRTRDRAPGSELRKTGLEE
jgi:hypothetical protein